MGAEATKGVHNGACREKRGGLRCSLGPPVTHTNTHSPLSLLLLPSLLSSTRKTTPKKQAMYVRVKRQKLTVFLQVEPNDTLGQLKARLGKLVDMVSR